MKCADVHCIVFLVPVKVSANGCLNVDNIKVFLSTDCELRWMKCHVWMHTVSLCHCSCFRHILCIVARVTEVEKSWSIHLSVLFLLHMSLCFRPFVKTLLPVTSCFPHFILFESSSRLPRHSRVTPLEETAEQWLLSDRLFWAACGGKHCEVMEVNVRSVAWVVHKQ